MCNLSSEELLLVLILATLLVVVEPLIGHQLIDGQRHQTRKNGVAGVLRSGRQYGAVEVVGGDIEVAAQHSAYGAPLVVAEVVDEQQRGLGVAIHHRKNIVAHQRMRHHRRILVARVYPILVVVADEAAKYSICLRLLVLQNLANRLVALDQLDIPIDQLAIDGSPLLEASCILHRGGNTTKLGTVVGGGLLGHKLLGLNVFLDERNHLRRVYGLDDIVGNLRAYSLVHNILLLALGYHNYGCGRAHILDKRKCLESRHSGHHLVEDNHIVGHLGSHIYCIVAIVAGLHLVPLRAEYHYVRLQQLNLVINP